MISWEAHPIADGAFCYVVHAHNSYVHIIRHLTTEDLANDGLPALCLRMEKEIIEFTQQVQEMVNEK